MITPPSPTVSSPAAKESTSFSPSLPAETTTTAPAMTAWLTAVRNVGFGAPPPSDRLITLAPLATA